MHNSSSEIRLHCHHDTNQMASILSAQEASRSVDGSHGISSHVLDPLPDPIGGLR